MAIMEPVLLSVRERSELLDSLNWSNNLTWTQIEQLSRFLLVFCVRANQPVFKEGEQASYMGLIAKGRLRVVKENSENTQQEIAVLGPGNAFGEMSLIDGEPRSASIFAAEDSTLLCLTEENFFSLLDEYPPIGIQILLTIAKSMSQRLRLTSGCLVEALSDLSASRAADDERQFPVPRED